jgi:hypothetical protein
LFSLLPAKVFSNSAEGGKEAFSELLNTYSTAYKNADFSILNAQVITSVEYKALIDRLEAEHSDCLTPLERNYEVDAFKRSFETSHLRRVLIDTIVIDNISSYETCPGLEVKKLSCYVYYNNKSASVSVQVVVIKISGEFKILTDVIDEKSLAKE